MISQTYTLRRETLELYYAEYSKWEYSAEVFRIEQEFWQELENVYGRQPWIWDAAWDLGYTGSYEKLEDIYANLASRDVPLEC